MTVGLEVVFKELFYDGLLEPGVATEFDHPSRENSRDWQEQIRSRYPLLSAEPTGMASASY